MRRSSGVEVDDLAACLAAGFGGVGGGSQGRRDGQIGMDQDQLEHDGREEVDRRVCECCKGSGVLAATSIKDPPLRECEYCQGRGWWPVLPVIGSAWG